MSAGNALHRQVDGWALGRFQDGSDMFAGLVVGDRAIRLESAGVVNGPATIRALLDDWGRVRPVLAGLAEAAGPEDGVPLSSLRVAAPVEPRQIFQAGANYRSHVAEIIVSGREPGDTRSDDELRRVAEALMDERARTGSPFFFAGLPAAICGPDDEVLSRAVGDGLRGVEVATYVAGLELADPSLEPFWSTAAELDAVVFVHPWGCTLGERLSTAYLSNIVGNPVETAVALSRLIFSGLLDRYPGLKILAAHGGGYLPGYLGRGDHAWQVRPDSRTCAEQPSAYLRRLWFDALVYTPEGLRTLTAAAGADRVLLGTDYPFDMGITDPLDRLAAASLPSSASESTRGGNAPTLLGALPALLPDNERTGS